MVYQSEGRNYVNRNSVSPFRPDFSETASVYSTFIQERKIAKYSKFFFLNVTSRSFQVTVMIIPAN